MSVAKQNRRSYHDEKRLYIHKYKRTAASLSIVETGAQATGRSSDYGIVTALNLPGRIIQWQIFALFHHYSGGTVWDFHPFPLLLSPVNPDIGTNGYSIVTLSHFCDFYYIIKYKIFPAVYKKRNAIYKKRNATRRYCKGASGGISMAAIPSISFFNSSMRA